LIEVRDGLCGICPAGCWVRATIEDGQLRQVEPLPDHPLGMICTNGVHSPEIVHDPQRLQHPLKRVGPKGTFEFEPISWEEAMDTIAGRLQAIKAESGPEATAIYTGRGSFELSLCDIFQPAGVAISSASSVLFPFGSPNTLGVGALCYVSFAMIAPHTTMGEMYHTMDFDIDQAQLIVVWGANPATDSPPLAHEQIQRARQRGAEVVVIDPRRTETARDAGAEWVPIRPGTDGALALGLINVLVEEELYDEEFVSHWTVGWEPLLDYIQHFRPEAVEEITGIPAAKVVELARRIAQARGACPVMYTGLEYADSGVQAIRAVFTLWAVAGQLDVPGGLLFRMKENRFPINRQGLVENPDVRQALGRDRFPVYSMYRGESHAIALPDSILKGEPYKIRSLMILGGSIITAWPNPSDWREALAALDFQVTIDRHFTADSAWADIVLPATTGYEISSYMTYGPLFKIRDKLIEPVGEARDDFHILSDLATRLGYGDKYPQSDEERLRYALEGSGFTLEEVRANGGEVRRPTVMTQYKKWERGLLREDGQPGFDTPSAKFEIASSILEEHGYDALPVYTEPKEGPLARPDLAQRYPLVFNSGARIFADFRSQHHGVPGLQRKAPEPLVTLNTEDAKERGIASGDQVFLETLRGRLKYRAHVTDDIVPGAIEANMGGGGPLGTEAWKECNVNDLTDLANYDPISGFPVYKALLCEVVRAEGDGRPRPEPDREESEADASAGAVELLRPTRQVYLDNNATSNVHAEVLEAMLPFLKDQGGNPSSIHGRGVAGRDAVEGARRKVAQVLNCTARRVVFTSGGSEADNLAIKGLAFALQEKGNHIITTAIEHPAVLNACRGLRPFGFETTVLEVDAEGRVDQQELAEALRPETILVSVMMANNEIGTVQPIADLAALAHERGALFHTDAVQALGKIPIDVKELDVDLLSLSAHKAHGPKGVGALYVRSGIALSPLIDGGGQERKLRSGTENVPGIVGFGKACDLAARWLNQKEPARITALRDRLEAGIRQLVPDARLNGHPVQRLPNTLNLSLPGMRGESLVLFLDRHGVYFSSGSACKSGNPAPSHVLLSIGLTEDEAHCAVRLSLGVDNDEADIDYVLEALGEVIRESQSSVRFVSCR
jgi:cysteine desulfurase NifS